MKAAHQRFRLRDDVARAVRILALWICLATVACLSAGCERSRDGEASNQASEAISKDRIWSFMINDSTPSARIRKWNKQELRGLMIIDQNRAAFFQQFSPLVRQIGDEIDIKIDACEAIMRPRRGPSSRSRLRMDQLRFLFRDHQWNVDGIGMASSPNCFARRSKQAACRSAQSSRCRAWRRGTYLSNHA